MLRRWRLTTEGVCVGGGVRARARECVVSVLCAYIMSVLCERGALTHRRDAKLFRTGGNRCKGSEGVPCETGAHSVTGGMPCERGGHAEG